jgi:hypothetical protein
VTFVVRKSRIVQFPHGTLFPFEEDAEMKAQSAEWDGLVADFPGL